MKSRYRNILSVFLSLVVFVSSNGVVVAAHNCFSNHKAEVSLFEGKCCSREKEKCHSKPVIEHTFTKKCCELKVSYHKVDVKTPVFKSISIQSQNLFSHELLFSAVSSFSGCSFSTDFNKAPPFISSGVSLLHSICTLQI
jgi:hypothetical protein